MESRQLGRTGLQVSLLGLGSGGMNRLGQKKGLAKQESIALVRRALELGVTFFDTAPAYGAAEELLGEALAGVPRDSYVLATKFQPKGAAGLKQPDELAPSLEESLRKLRTDYVDVLYLHGVTPDLYESIVDCFVEPLHKACASGKARYSGMTELFEKDDAHEAVQRALASDQFDVVMMGLNALSPSAVAQVLPAARQHDVGVVVMCAIRSVISNPELLRETVRRWTEEGLLPSGELDEEAPLDWLLGDGVESVTDAAYKFAAAPPDVGCVLTGTADPEHLAANVKAIEGRGLPKAKVKRLLEVFAPVRRNASHPDFQ